MRESRVADIHRQTRLHFRTPGGTAPPSVPRSPKATSEGALQPIGLREGPLQPMGNAVDKAAETLEAPPI